MLRWDRNTLPVLPRPVYEIEAEIMADQLRVTVNAGPDGSIAYTEWPLTEPTMLEAPVRRWLCATGRFASDDDRWVRVARQVAHEAIQRLVIVPRADHVTAG